MSFHKFLFLMSLALTACSIAPAYKFPDVKHGMEKGEVLEKLGSPSRTDRQDSNDIWIYKFYNEDHVPTEKVVIFQNGTVSYVGLPLNSENILKGTPNESHVLPAGD